MTEFSALCTGVVLAFALSGCGQNPLGADRARVIAAGQDRPDSFAVLYRDGVMVTRRYDVAFDAHGQARLAPLAEGPATARLVNDIDGIAFDVIAHTDGQLVLHGGRPRTRAAVEVSTWLDDVSWKVRYAVITDGKNRARIRGLLTVVSRLNRPLRVEEFWIVDADRRGSVANGEQPPPRPRPFADALHVSSAAVLPANRSVGIALPTSADLVPFEFSHRFDGNNDEVAHQGVVPILSRSYGTQKNNIQRPVILSMIFGREVGQGNLPRGAVNVLTRTAGGLRSRHLVTGFGSSESSKSNARRKTGLRQSNEVLQLGDSPGLSGRRWQADFAVDLVRKRLVEEIRIEMTNETGIAQTVEVLERQARGLNWSLAYHNESGSVEKVNEQAIRFVLRVPPNGSKLVMYRVVYFWN